MNVVKILIMSDRDAAIMAVQQYSFDVKQCPYLMSDHDYLRDAFQKQRLKLSHIPDELIKDISFCRET